MPYVSYSDTVELYRRGMEKGQANDRAQVAAMLDKIIDRVGPDGCYCIPLGGPGNVYERREMAVPDVSKVVFLDAIQLMAIRQLIAGHKQ